jgi:hypothetical protein
MEGVGGGKCLGLRSANRGKAVEQAVVLEEERMNLAMVEGGRCCGLEEDRRVRRRSLAIDEMEMDLREARWYRFEAFSPIRFLLAWSRPGGN